MKISCFLFEFYRTVFFGIKSRSVLKYQQSDTQVVKRMTNFQIPLNILKQRLFFKLTQIQSRGTDLSDWR